MFTNRNAATVIDYFNRIVFMNANDDARGVSRHRFVNRVVYDLINKVVEAALISGADIHSWTLADRIKPFKDLDAGGAVVAPLLPCRSGRLWRRTGFFWLFCDFGTAFLTRHYCSPLIWSTSLASSSAE